MDRLSTLDTAFLRVETPTGHMHVGWTAGLELAPGARRLDVAGLRARIEARLDAIPRFRQKVVRVPLGLAEPVWADDDAFDLEWHVRVARLDPAEPPGGAHVRGLVDDFLGRPLDRSRPLWELLVVPGLAGGHALIAGKVHHAMVDGLAAVQLGMLLFDVDPDAPAGAARPAELRPAAPGLRLAADAAVDLAIDQLRLARSTVRLGLSPRQGARLADAARKAALGLAEDALAPAPRSYLNAEITARRALVPARLELERLRRVKDAARVKLNDVVLALVAGALRAHAGERGERPGPLRAMVPVSVRRPGDEGGNRIVFGFVDLPSAFAPSSVRLRAVRHEMQQLKHSDRIGGSDLLLRSLSPLPGPVKDRAARLLSSPRLYNLVVSNVPGPPVGLYVAGARVRDIHPVIPLSDGHALAVGLLTYDGWANVGLHVAPDALADAETLPPLLERELGLLERAFGVAGAPRRVRPGSATRPAPSGAPVRAAAAARPR
jgi:diacylglycerol O-acyltransferase